MRTPAKTPNHLLRLAAAAAAVVTVLVVAAVIALRVGTPFALEWLEGSMVAQTARIAAGDGLYVPPTVDFVPFLYTPLYHWLGAPLGPGYLPLRLLSIAATVGCAVLLALLVRRDRGGGWHMLVAIGVFASGYGWLATWYDLARNDMVFAVAMLAVIWLLRTGGARAAALAGIVATIAFLTKQTALFWLPAIGVGALLLDRRRGAVFATTGALGIAAACAIGHVATRGWFTFYVFEMPSGHAIQGEFKLGFWTGDLVPIAPLLALALTGCWRMLRHERCVGLFWLAVIAGGMSASWLSRLHAGGFDNVLLYVFVACIAPAVAAVNGRASASLAVVVQFVLLWFDVRALWSDRPALLFDPSRAVPTAAQVEAHRELAQWAQTQRGQVWLPFRSHLPGLTSGANAAAISDLMQRFHRNREPGRIASARSQTAELGLAESARVALAERRFTAIVLESPAGDAFAALLRELAPDARPYNRLELTAVRDGAALRPLVGLPVCRPWLLVP